MALLKTETSGDASIAAVPQACLVCGGLRHRPVFNEFGTDVLRCQQCGHVFSSFAADPHFDGFWGEEVAEEGLTYWKQRRAGMFGDFLQRFIAGRSGRLLDVGCGLGFFLQAAAAHPQWECYGCEISSAAVRYARDKLGLPNILCGQPEKADLPPGSFDIITMWDVLDHLREPDALLRHCHTLLKAGGMCFIRTPNVSVHLLRARLKRALRGMRVDISYLQARDHSHHYSPRSIRSVLGRNGFADVEFVHLRPVDAEIGKARPFVRAFKKAGFHAVRALAFVSRGRLNLDNLFVVARKA